MFPDVVGWVGRHHGEEERQGRRGRRWRGIIAGFVLSAICDCLYIFASQIWQIFLLQVALGLALALLNPAWDILYTEGGNSEEKWTAWNGGISFVAGLAALIASLLVQLNGFTLLFILMASADLVAIYCVYGAKIPQHVHHDTCNDYGEDAKHMVT